MKEVRELIKRLSRESRMTIFLSSHLLSEVEMVATRMAVIHRGELIAQGEVSELLGKEATDYSIEVSPLPLALGLLENLSWVKVLSAENGKMEIRMEPGRSSELNRLLVMNQVQVFSFSPHRTLEDFFLKVTEGTSDI
jgi:ABC-type multidrug transport system ATPase subunit